MNPTDYFNRLKLLSQIRSINYTFNENNFTKWEDPKTLLIEDFINSNIRFKRGYIFFLGLIKNKNLYTYNPYYYSRIILRTLLINELKKLNISPLKTLLEGWEEIYFEE